tara:strand:- start:74 stop:916 length:843 start_codon:yes stop_codon:yes gene_type:complete
VAEVVTEVKESRPPKGFALDRLNSIIGRPRVAEPGIDTTRTPGANNLSQLYKFALEDKFGVNLLKNAMTTKWRGVVLEVITASGADADKVGFGVRPPPQVEQLLRGNGINKTDQYALKVGIEIFSDWLSPANISNVSGREHTDYESAASFFPTAYPRNSELARPEVGQFIWCSLVSDQDYTNFVYEDIIDSSYIASMIYPVRELDPRGRFDPCAGELELQAVLSFDLGEPIEAKCSGVVVDQLKIGGGLVEAVAPADIEGTSPEALAALEPTGVFGFNFV